MKTLISVASASLMHCICGFTAELVMISDYGKQCTVDIGNSEISAVLLENVFWENLTCLYPQYILSGAAYTITHGEGNILCSTSGT